MEYEDIGIIDPNLVLALSGSVPTPNNPPTNFFVRNGGQFQLETVPEPATIALMGLGIVGLSLRFKRQRD